MFHNILLHKYSTIHWRFFLTFRYSYPGFQYCFFTNKRKWKPPQLTIDSSRTPSMILQNCTCNLSTSLLLYMPHTSEQYKIMGTTNESKVIVCVFTSIFTRFSVDKNSYTLFFRQNLDSIFIKPV